MGRQTDRQMNSTCLKSHRGLQGGLRDLESRRLVAGGWGMRVPCGEGEAGG